MEKLSDSFGKMSRSGSLNVGKSVIAEENYKTGTGNISRRSLPAVNIPTLERLQQQDPAQGIENFLYFSNSYLEVGNSFDGITKRSSKQTEKGLAYPALIHAVFHVGDHFWDQQNQHPKN